MVGKKCREIEITAFQEELRFELFLVIALTEY